MSTKVAINDHLGRHIYIVNLTPDLHCKCDAQNGHFWPFFCDGDVTLQCEMPWRAHEYWGVSVTF